MKIRIKKSKRGTFTAAAKKRGMSVQEFASKVLANKENYSPAMIKKANFARNFGGHKHAIGGTNYLNYPFGVMGYGAMHWPDKYIYENMFEPDDFETMTGATDVDLERYVTLRPDANEPTTVIGKRAPKGKINPDLLARRLGESLRYAPALGAALGALEARLQPKDYALANELRDIASKYQPISAPHIGGYRRYIPYDVNLGDSENIALTARALEANRGQNRATQGALNAAVINAVQKTAAARNLAAQQANEANRLATDQYNLGIDQFNTQRDTQYDQLNQQILNNRLRTLMSAAEAEDASRTAWAQNISGTTENMYNQLGNVGRDNWARNQRDIYLRDLGYDPVALLSLFNLNNRG